MRIKSKMHRNLRRIKRDIHLDANSVITAVGVLSALGTVLFWVLKAHRWFLNQEAQDGRLKDIEKNLTGKIEALEKKHDADMDKSKEERRIVCYGLAACLDGLQQLGCNHSVSEAKAELDKYLNAKAHE